MDWIGLDLGYIFCLFLDGMNRRCMSSESMTQPVMLTGWLGPSPSSSPRLNMSIQGRGTYPSSKCSAKLATLRVVHELSGSTMDSHLHRYIRLLTRIFRLFFKPPMENVTPSFTDAMRRYTVYRWPRSGVSRSLKYWLPSPATNVSSTKHIYIYIYIYI